MISPMELFERTLRAWDLEVVEVQEEGVTRKRFHHTPSGTTLKVRWSVEVMADLKHFLHGDGTERDVILMLLEQVARGLFDIPAPPSNQGIVDIVTHCPECGLLHLDEGEWRDRPHKTHLCAKCGALWRPNNDHHTRGVAFG